MSWGTREPTETMDEANPATAARAAIEVERRTATNDDAATVPRNSPPLTFRERQEAMYASLGPPLTPEEDERRVRELLPQLQQRLVRAMEREAADRRRVRAEADAEATAPRNIPAGG